MVFRQHGDRDRLDPAQHPTLQWQLAILDLRGNFRIQRAAIRSLPPRVNPAICSLPGNLPCHGQTSNAVIISGHVSYGTGNDNQHDLLRLRSGLGAMG